MGGTRRGFGIKRRARKNVKFKQLHPDGRKAFAKEKRAVRHRKHVEKLRNKK